MGCAPFPAPWIEVALANVPPARAGFPLTATTVATAGARSKPALRLALRLQEVAFALSADPSCSAADPRLLDVEGLLWLGFAARPSIEADLGAKAWRRLPGPVDLRGWLSAWLRWARARRIELGAVARGGRS